MSDPLDQVLDEQYVADLTSLDIETVRQRRGHCKEIETGCSYLRRVVQSRLDIVAAEQARRAEGGAPDDLEGLIERLPKVLAEKTRSAGFGRMPQSFGTGLVDTELAAELDAIAAPSVLADPSAIPDAQLSSLHEALLEYEAKVSGVRRHLFDRIDAFEAELTRRYRTGEATVDSLLH